MGNISINIHSTQLQVLGILKRQFPDTPVMGLTATATSKVFNDCKSILNLSSCLVFKASYNRQNLFYEVREKPSSYKDQIASIETLINTQFCRQSGKLSQVFVYKVGKWTGHRCLFKKSKYIVYIKVVLLFFGTYMYTCTS